MDAKLKALKVVDLKDILAKAAVSVPAKANKQDLIARILASNPALDVYHDLHSPKPPHNDDLVRCPFFSPTPILTSPIACSSRRVISSFLPTCSPNPPTASTGMWTRLQQPNQPQSQSHRLTPAQNPYVHYRPLSPTPTSAFLDLCPKTQGPYTICPRCPSRGR